jgi:type VI secretion system secreted protein VgrG
VVLAGGAIADNVVWQVGSSATIGTSTAFQGNIFALASVTGNTGATNLGGRWLAINGAVTLDDNTIG